MITRVRKERYQKWFTFNLDIIELPASVISPEAKNFWQYLFSRPDGWEYSRAAAIKLLGSGHKVDKATAELKSLQLLEIVKLRENGKFCGYDWVVKAEPVLQAKADTPTPESDTPDPDYQDTVEPDLDIPDPDIPDPAIQDTLKEIPSLKEKTSLKERPRRAPERSENFEETEQPPQDPPASQNDDPLIAEMQAIPSPVDSPLSKDQALNLLRRYGPEACRTQLDWLPFHSPHNAVAVFQTALKNSWGPPKAWHEHQAKIKQQEREQAERERKREESARIREAERERQRQMEAERAAWDKLTTEEQQAILAERDRWRKETNPMTLTKAKMVATLTPERRAAALDKMPQELKAEILSKLPLEQQDEYLAHSNSDQVFNLNTCNEEAVA